MGGIEGDDDVGKPNGNGIPGYQLSYIKTNLGTSGAVSTRFVIATMLVRVLRKPASGQGTIQVDAQRTDGATGYFRSGQAGNRQNYNLIKNATVTILGFAIRPIPDVLLPPGGSTTIDLNQYVDTNVTWSPASADSLTTPIDPQTNILTVRANDGFVGVRDLGLSATTLAGGETVQTSVRVVVNSRPTIPAGSFPDTLRIVEDKPDSSFLLTGRAKDADSPTTPLTWTASGGTSVGVRLKGNQVVLTPAQDFNGSERLKFVVTDQYGARDSTTMVVTVTPVNDGPVFTRAFPSLTIPLGSQDNSILLNAYLRDVDHDLSDPRYVYFYQTTDSVLVNIQGLRVTVTPVPGALGDKKINITAIDPDGAKVTQTLTARVTPPTGPTESPVVKPPVPDKVGMVRGGAQVTLALDPLVTDPDTPDDQMVWTVSPGPSARQVQVTLGRSGGQQRAILQAPQTFVGFELLTFTATDPTNLSGSFQMIAFSVEPGTPDVGGLPDTSVVAGGRTPYVNFNDYIFADNYPDSALAITPVALASDLAVQIDPATRASFIVAAAAAAPGTRQVVFEVRNRDNQRGLDTIQVRVDPAGQVRLRDFPGVTFRADQSDQSLRLDDYVLSGGAGQLVWTAGGFNPTRLTVTIDASRVVTFRSVGGFTGQEVVTLTARDPKTSNTAPGVVQVTVLPAAAGGIKLVSKLPDVTLVAGTTDQSLRLNRYVTAGDTNQITWQARVASGRSTVTASIAPTTRVVTIGSAPGFAGVETVIFTAKVGQDSAETSATVTVTPAGGTVGDLKLVTIANPVQRAFVDVFVASKRDLASEPTVIVELSGARSLVSLRKITWDRVGNLWNGNLTLRIGQVGSGRILASAVTTQQIALSDTLRFTVGTVNPGFALTVSGSGASLTMPPGAFRESAVVALVQNRDGEVGGGAAAKPAGGELIPVSEAYLVVMTETPARAGELRFDLGPVDAGLAERAGVYRKDGEEWVYVAGRGSRVAGHGSGIRADPAGGALPGDGRAGPGGRFGFRPTPRGGDSGDVPA